MMLAEGRRRETLEKLARFRAIAAPRVALVDVSHRPITDIARRYRIDDIEIEIHDDPDAALRSSPDLLLAALRGIAVERTLFDAQRRAPPPLVVGWTWDNHHTIAQSVREALLCDLVFPGHWYCAAELSTPLSITGPHVPLCLFQWTAAEIGPLFARFGGMARSDALVGGFNEWGMRGRFIREVAAALPDTALTIHDAASWTAFRAQSPADRFVDWAGHKVSLCVPVRADLSNRLFDALATGQVPLVIGPCRDLTRVFSPAEQAMLPILHEPDLTVDAVRRGHAAARARFDAEGMEGALRRHRWIVDRHLIEHRLGTMLALLRRDDVAIDVSDDGPRVYGRIRWG